MDIFQSINDRKKLQQFLISKPSKLPKQLSSYSDYIHNNWNVICLLWNINNSNSLIDLTSEMPNYTTIRITR